MLDYRFYFFFFFEAEIAVCTYDIVSQINIIIKKQNNK